MTLIHSYEFTLALKFRTNGTILMYKLHAYFDTDSQVMTTSATKYFPNQNSLKFQGTENFWHV